MKIGILTFHSQLNYGGVLQAWALQTTLRNLGHEAVVIDRWMGSRNEALLGAWPHGIRSLVRRGFNIICLNGIFGTAARRIKTQAFISRNLELTPYHFCHWRDAPKDLGLDCVVVGSDQVWNSYGAKDPSVYLLLGAPEVKAISYAASLGMRSIDGSKTHLYRAGLKRFAAISVRERSAVDILEKIGISATHVCDPVLLLSSDEWRNRLCVTRNDNNRKIVCYFISELVADIYAAVESFVSRNGAVAEIYISHPMQLRALGGWRKIKGCCGDKVRIKVSADPQEFVSALCDAEWVVTDSFHAVMFSAIFGKNVRVVRPKLPTRIEMFERIEEIGAMSSNPVAFSCVDIGEAVDSLEKLPEVTFSKTKLGEFRKTSLDWLKGALECIAM